MKRAPDLRPLWSLVWNPSAFGPELAYSLCVAQPTLMDIPLYIFDILLYYYIYLWTTFLWLLRCGWMLVLSLYKEDYLLISKCVFFWLHGSCGKWEGERSLIGLPHKLRGFCLLPLTRSKIKRDFSIVLFFHMKMKKLSFSPVFQRNQDYFEERRRSFCSISLYLSCL